MALVRKANLPALLSVQDRRSKEQAQHRDDSPRTKLYNNGESKASSATAGESAASARIAGGMGRSAHASPQMASAFPVSIGATPGRRDGGTLFLLSQAPERV